MQSFHLKQAETERTMEVRLVGDDNREIVVSIPLNTTIKNIRRLIGEKLIISEQYIMDLNLQKMKLPSSDDIHDNKEKEEYVDLFNNKSIDINDNISMNKYLKSGDTIYINNVSSFCDPNVWKLNQEWNKLMDIKSSLNDLKFMKFIELITRVCENIIEDPQNQKYRHLNYQKIEKKISDIPNGMEIFKYIGFIKKSDKDFNFYVMHSLKPLKHILKCIYIKFPELRPKDVKFMSQFDSFDTKEQKFEVEKKEEKEKIEQIIEQRRQFYQNRAPNEEAIVRPSTGTKLANLWHVILENIMLVVIILPICWWLIKALFWPYFQEK